MARHKWFSTSPSDNTPGFTVTDDYGGDVWLTRATFASEADAMEAMRAFVETSEWIGRVGARGRR